MSKFEERKNAFLKEHKASEEQKFKIRNLTNKKLAAWVGELIDLTEEQQKQLMQTLIEKDIVQTGQALVVQEVADVLKQHGKAYEVEAIEEKIIALTKETAVEVQKG